MNASQHRRSKFVVAPLVTLLFSFSAFGADTIEFPDEELASESVLPVFDHAVSVKNRTILTTKRWELGPMIGMSLLEPFYNPMSFGASLAYHKSEEHTFAAFFAYFMQGLSSNASGLNPVPGTANNVNLQFAPAPKYMILGEYQYTGFYGKISLGKDFVMNLSTFGLIGGGVMGVGDGVNPAVDFGLGQKLYFSRNFALRVDWRMIVFQGPDVLSKDLSAVRSEKPASFFDTTTNISSMLSLSAIYLFK